MPGTGRALVLGGGGLLGAMFQIGVLAELEKLQPERLRVDVIVGTSGGAVVAAFLAAGLPPSKLRELAPRFAPCNLTQVCWRSVLRWMSRAPLFALSRFRAAKRAGGASAAESLRALVEAAPSAILSLDPLEAFIARTLEERGVRDRFDALPGRLLVPAIDLDWGERVVFGGRGQTRATISRAVAASSAVPRVFRPVRIEDRDFVDGGLTDVLNMDLALRPGITEVLAIHAVVAPINDGRIRCLPSPGGGCGRISEQGYGAVSRQASKIGHMLVTHALAQMMGRLRPEVSIEMIQPDRLEMDLDDLMDFRSAARLLDEGARSAQKIIERGPGAWDEPVA